VENNYRLALQNLPTVPQGFFPVINEKMGMIMIRADTLIRKRRRAS
jgi:hypothetical protein